MSKKLYASNVIDQAQDVLVGLAQIGATLTFGTVTTDALITDLAGVAPLEAEITRLEKQLADKRNQRDALCLSVWDKVKRMRSGVKGNYGDDSTQYELVGGTRMSERKPRARKAVTELVPA